MEPEPIPTQCDACVWWVEPADGDDGHCPYRRAATGSNAAWKQITLGRCSHHLAAGPSPDVDDGTPDGGQDSPSS